MTDGPSSQQHVILNGLQAMQRYGPSLYDHMCWTSVVITHLAMLLQTLLLPVRGDAARAPSQVLQATCAPSGLNHTASSDPRQRPGPVWFCGACRASAAALR